MYNKPMAQLTKKQIKRQDFVDNEIFELIQRLMPSVKIKWDIEMIGNIRDSMRIQIVDKQKLTSETKFYPYLKI
ncbi:MAG: hypothetical protein UT33_C0003G0006 [Candidatus Peregrinibacteria bacterium GW2011_GWC2_39_14]|nr:MAG: hypothetical protein UT33_C0003G0006 [Candidatus Peregrinibacteria bacterium GW2011_GWC2_39_14]